MPTMVQIRNVPDDLLAELKARAARERRSLSDYLLGHLRQIAERPTLDEVLDRFEARPRRELGISAADLIAESRDE